MMRALLFGGTLLLFMATAAPLRSQVVISEFMSSNTKTLADENGEFSDWIELHNTSAAAVDLDNWYLTDDAARLTQWRFPATNLPPNGFLVVFASSKDRHQAGAPLHTNFKLTSSGEYLGLVLPDGKQVVSDYAPAFPAQLDDVSFGLDTGTRPVTLISSNALARLMFPSDDSLALSWTLPAFDDHGWRTAIAPIGYALGELNRVPQPGLLASLAGYWKLDETNGPAFADASGVASDGLIVGYSILGNPRVAGISGNAVRFRGSSYRAVGKVENYPKATNALSVSAWIWADARTTSATIAKNGSSTSGQFHFGLRDTAGDLDVILNTTAGSFNVHEGIPLSTGSWHHVAFAANGSILRLFRDGELVAAKSYTGDIVVPSSPYLGIGAKLNEAGTLVDSLTPGIWNGRLDELALWNRGLSETEVAAIYDAGVRFGTAIKTDLTRDLFEQRSSAFFRFPFVVTDPSTLVNWRLSFRYDDGVIVWVNGQEVARRNAPDPAAWNSLAIEARPQSDAREPELMNLNDSSSAFLPGTNVLAIQVFNISASDNDFIVDPQLEASSIVNTTNQPSYFTSPTPGKENRFGIPSLGPVISAVAHSPAVPSTGEELKITARVTAAFSPVAAVSLIYRVQYSNSVSLSMVDDGSHGDGAAGDSIFTGVIPAGSASPGQMIRYAIVATDSVSRTNRLPLFPDKLNSEEYYGTVVQDPSLTNAMPVMQWFVKNPSLAENDPGTQSSIYYDGEFYDNVYIRIRGGTSRSWPKKSYKVEMTPEHEFRIHPGVATVTEFDLNTTYTDKSYVRARLHSDHQLAAGMPSPEIFHTRLEQNGKFYSVTLWTEQPDSAFLRRHGMDDQGSLYKAGPGANADTDAGFEKKTRKFEDTSDLKAFLKGLQLKGSALEAFVFDNLDIPGQLNYMATVAIAQNIDASDKNYFLYRDTPGGAGWRMLPWDLDLSFGPDALNTDTIVFNQADPDHYTSHPFIGANPYVLSSGKRNAILEAIVNTPRTRQMLIRRIHTLVEQFLIAPYFQDRIDQLAPEIAADVKLDQKKWGANAFYSTPAFTLQQALDRIKNEYLLPRPGYLTSFRLPGIGSSNVSRQPYAPFLSFGELLINPSSGDQNEEYAQLVNTNSIPIDLTGWRVTGAVDFAFKPATVIPGNGLLYLTPRVLSFQARASSPHRGEGLFVQGNYRGHLSARGGVLRLINDYGLEISVTHYPGVPSLAQQFLRITELMYHPPSLTGDAYKADEFEYLELRNLSDIQALDLAGVRFTRGIAFDFTGSGLSRLEPGQRVLIVKNSAAFQSRYGVGERIAGQYLGSLSNGRDALRLEDASGEKILEFSYSNRWYPITDGLGFSLVLTQEPLDPELFGNSSSWQISSRRLGSPGRTELARTDIPPIQVNEVLAASVAPAIDRVELFNPTAAIVALGDWYLTDDFNNPKKYRIPPGVSIPAGGYRLFSEADFNTGLTAFSFGGDGDEVWIFSGDASGNLTGYVHGYRFGASEPGVTLGRHIDSIGRQHLAPQSQPSLGFPNTGPRVGPLVISEIAFHPAPSRVATESELEFVELQNVTSLPLNLFTAGSPNSEWRLEGGIELRFPSQLTVPSKGLLLAVGFDPVQQPSVLASFRQAYALDPTVVVVGPWKGALGNSGDSVRVVKPREGASGNWVGVVMDEVNYSDSGEGSGGDGDGSSIHRLSPIAFGDDPKSWVAATLSPGNVYLPGPAPVLQTEPTSQVVNAFESVEFQVLASGAGPLSYRWRHDGSLLAGETQKVLRLDPLQPSQRGNYQATVFNRFGSAVSSNATLTIKLPPFIIVNPLDQRVREGSNVVFKVAALGTGTLRYQWRREGTPFGAGTNDSFAIPNATVAQSGLYDCLITDDIGTAVSDPASLTVTVLPTLHASPDDTTVLVGQPIRLLVSATESGPTGYRWRRGTTAIANQNGPLLVISNAQPVNAGNYTVAVTNLSGSVTSAIVVVTVLADVDKDGMSDLWEASHGFNTNSPADATIDLDGDGVSNRNEYLAGTDPADPQSFLHWNPATPIRVEGEAAVALSFQAISNHTYAVLRRTDPALSQGTNVWSTPSHPTNWVAWITNRIQLETQNFYRIQTPRGP